MSIHRTESGRWAARTLDNNGRHLQRTFRTRREAETWETQTRTDILNNDHIDPRHGATTLDTYLAEWIDSHQGTVAPSTLTRYQQTRTRFADTLGHVRLRDLTTTKIQKAVGQLDLAASTITTDLSILSSALTTAIADSLIRRNPCEKVKRPKQTKRPPAALTPDEVAAVLDQPMTDRDRALVATMAFAGLRVGETLGLRVADVDLLHGRINVQVQRDLQNVERPTKSYAVREVPIILPLRKLLTTHLEGHDGVSSLLFYSSLHNPVSRPQVKRVLDRSLDRAGVGRVRRHDLRHSAASWLLSAGASVVSVSKWLGHSSVKVTLDTYAHVMPDDLGRAGEALERLWDERGRSAS